LPPGKGVEIKKMGGGKVPGTYGGGLRKKVPVQKPVTDPDFERKSKGAGHKRG